VKAKSSIWDFLIATGVLFGLIVLVSNQEPKAAQRNRNYRAQSPDDLEAEPISHQTKYEEWHPEEREHKSEERAYWRRQHSNSRWSLIFNILTFGTAILAVGIAYWAYQASTQAVVEAKRQADAAGTQIDIAKSAERRQIRAYAFPTPIGISDFELGKSPAGGVNVKTMGQTPAYKVRGQVGVGGLTYPLREEETLEIKKPDQVQNSTFITPTNIFIVKATALGILNQAAIDAVNSGRTLRLFVWGRVDYEDIFADPHWFTFCYSYDGISIKEHDGGEPCPRHNEDDRK
jgi:hypothetical protein